ncbi:MAG: hypothetical protein LBG89_01540 [Rickettsiales bacterium]|jgi:hypothetical protein|nr:hypothetical protein [Rickettsiales bacterium]
MIKVLKTREQLREEKESIEALAAAFPKNFVLTNKLDERGGPIVKEFVLNGNMPMSPKLREAIKAFNEYYGR